MLPKRRVLMVIGAHIVAVGTIDRLKQECAAIGIELVVFTTRHTPDAFLGIYDLDKLEAGQIKPVSEALDFNA